MSETQEKNCAKQGYRVAWERNPTFRDWIQSVPNKPLKAYCRYCKCLLYAHHHSVLKHLSTSKHEKNTAIFKATQKIKEQICLALDTENDTTLDVGEKTEMASYGFDNSTDGITERNAILIECNNAGDYIEIEDVASNTESIDENLYMSDDNQYEIVDGCELLYENYIEDKDRTESTSSMNPAKPLISTHILDTTLGKAAANVPVTLYVYINEGTWLKVKDSQTNDDGRCADLITDSFIQGGRYKLHFDVHSYFKAHSIRSLYPFIEIVFDTNAGEHYHIPLLLNPFGYSTYRGT